MRFCLLLIVVAAVPVTRAAQSTTIVSGNTKRSISWDKMVGHSVTVEGLAWGARAKGLGQHLILPNGRVYVSGFDFIKRDANGRLLSIVGILRKRHVKKAPPGAQGYSSDFDYFYIDATSWKTVERLTNPQILPHKKK